jgi:hypothetical protein
MMSNNYFPNVKVDPKEIEDVIDIILSDAEINEFINKFNIDLKANYFILYQYYLEKNICKNCPGVTKCNNTFTYYEPILSYDESLEIIHKRCKKVISFDNFKYSDYDINDFLLIKKNMKNIDKYTNLINETAKIKDNNYSIFLQTNIEESLKIVKIIANKLSLSNTITFIDLKKRSYIIREDIYNDKEEFLKYIDKLASQDILILYNLGDESVSQVYIEEFLITLIKKYINKKLIIVSEYNGDDLALIYNLNGKVNLRFKKLLEKFHKTIHIS